MPVWYVFVFTRRDCSSEDIHWEGIFPWFSIGIFYYEEWLRRTVRAVNKKTGSCNMWADTILILFINICTALLGEGKRTKVLNLEEERWNSICSNSMCIYVYCLYVWMCYSGLTWLMVYRTEKYQKLKAEVEKQSKKRKFAEIFSLHNVKTMRVLISIL